MSASLRVVSNPPACRICGASLTGSPSDDFCSEGCQRVWHANRTEAASVPERPAPRSGATVLDDVAAFLARYSAFPSQHCVPTLALWYAHTHAASHFYVTPRLILDSAEPGSGKTRVLEVAQHLVASPEMTISATTAAIFRMVSDGPITILFDEVDAIFSAKNGGNYEDLRALLNAGYKRSATVARCVGDAKAMKVERFPVYAPAALAGIAGHMPATITTRAITIHMRRRAPSEHVEPFRERAVESAAEPLRGELAAWVESVVVDHLDGAAPAMPEGVTDRSAEIWEPLLAVADAAGDHWPETARAACSYFVTNADTRSGSLGVRLLADLHTLFSRHATDRMATTAILDELHLMEESPWADLYGKPLDARRLSRELARYNVKPGPVRVNGQATKGYQAGGETGLADAWARYLPPESVTAVTAVTSQVSPVTEQNAVTDPSVTPQPP